MGLIPSSSLEEIRAKLDIVELVGEYVPQMQRAGRNMKARCPFHQERTPSFIVSPERQTYHCFGCGEGGDAFSFLMKIENLNFSEAAEKLAEKAGVKIAASEEALGPEQKEKLKLKELLAFAADFYHGLLLNAPEAAAARNYLGERGVSGASVEGFKLGYAPRSGVIVDAAAKKGWAKELLVKAGLAAVSKETGRLRDYFYDRVLYPIWDAKGAAVGFGARTLGDGMPKYLNSPESPVFSKGKVLYGFSQGQAAIRKSRRALLMEGYMDVIAAHQHGLTTACAPLGTAVTSDHAALLKRYASDVTIVFDADSAGLNAAIRGAEILLAAGLGVRIATVPDGKDPDEHLHKHGVEAFESDCLGKAVDLVEFKTELLIKKNDGPLTPEAKSSIAKQVLATIEQCPDEILKSEWTRRLSQRLSIEEDSLKRQMAKTATHASASPHRSAYGNTLPSGNPQPVQLPESDRQLLALMFKEPRLCKMARESDFLSPAAKSMWQGLSALDPLPADWAARLLEGLGPAEKASASALLVLVGELESEEPEKVLRETLHDRRIDVRLAEIRAAMKAGAADSALIAELQGLSVARKGTKR